MGYYIDQLAEQDRKKRLADLLSAPETINENRPYTYEEIMAIRGATANKNAGGTLTVLDDGTVGVNGKVDYQIPRYMQDSRQVQPQQQVQIPQNYIQNERTGNVTDLWQSQMQRPMVDMSQNAVDTPMGRGYYMKGDNTRVVLADGRIADLGRDTKAERERMKEDLGFAKTRAEIAAMQAKPQLESPQQKLSNEIAAATERAKYPFTEEGARLAAQKAAADKAKAGEEGKPLPISAANALMSNQQSLRRAQEAQALLNGKNVGKAIGDKEATGWKGYAPDAMLQRMDPQGIDTRAAIADLGSLVIHDRSGAAVTALEFPRLQPFIPSPKDDPATARKKLNRFVMEYQNIVDEQTGFYKESGYKVPSEKLKQADVKPRSNDGIPPMETWVARAKELNPDMSGAEIEAEYMKKYRR